MQNLLDENYSATALSQARLFTNEKKINDGEFYELHSLTLIK